MNRKSRDKIIYIVIGVIILFCALRGYIINEKLKNNIGFAEGIIKEIQFPVDGDPVAFYQYKVNNKNYTGYYSIFKELPKFKVGDSVIIKFSLASQNISELLIKKEEIKKVISDSAWKSTFLFEEYHR